MTPSQGASKRDIFGKACHKQVSSRTVTEGSQIKKSLFGYPSAARSLNLSNMGCFQGWSFQSSHYIDLDWCTNRTKGSSKVDSNCNSQDGYFRGTQIKPMQVLPIYFRMQGAYWTKSRPPEKVSSFMFQCYRFVTDFPDATQRNSNMLQSLSQLTVFRSFFSCLSSQCSIATSAHCCWCWMAYT